MVKQERVVASGVSGMYSTEEKANHLSVPAGHAVSVTITIYGRMLYVTNLMHCRVLMCFT